RAGGAGPPGNALSGVRWRDARCGRRPRRPGRLGRGRRAAARCRGGRRHLRVARMTPALEVRGLAYAYPDGHQALFGGDLTAVLGPNGAGKTTFVLHLNGILRGGAGTVRVGGLDVGSAERDALREVRRRVGIVFQDPDDQLFMPTVRDDVAFGPANLGLRGAA